MPVTLPACSWDHLSNYKRNDFTTKWTVHMKNEPQSSCEDLEP